jgi:hypothetical protein
MESIKEKINRFIENNNYGFKVHHDLDGDIRLEFDLTDDKKLNCMVIFDDRDPNFLRIFLPSIWSIDSKKELVQAMKVCNKINEEVKVIKTVISKEKNWIEKDEIACIHFNCEVMVYDSINDSEVENLFIRLISIMKTTTSLLCKKMRNFNRDNDNNVVEKIIKKEDEEDGTSNVSSWYN